MQVQTRFSSDMGIRAFVASALMLAASSAMADVAAIEAAGVTALTYAGAVAGVLIAIWAAKLAYRKFFGG